MVLSHFQEKAQEIIVYFRARFGEKWCETTLILMRLGTFQSKMGLHPPFCYDDISMKTHSVHKSAKRS